MQKKMVAEVNRYIGRKRRRRLWTRVVAVLACAVVLCTAYALILPAIALEREKEAYCGYEEHQHTDSCYETGLICREEGEKAGEGQNPAEKDTDSPKASADIAESGMVHTHTDECYRTEKVLACDLEEGEGHTHGDGCFEPKLTCGREESEGHTHSEDCREVEERLICGMEMDEAHSHDASCYEMVETLICGLEEGEEHVHSDECYENVAVCGEKEREGHAHSEDCYEIKSVLSCEQDEATGTDESEKQQIKEETEEQEDEKEAVEYETPDETQNHVHTEECYGEKLTCGLEEHTHTLLCYSDPKADVETAEVWEKTLPEELTGIWADDLAAVAESQLGYEESTANYDVTEEEEVKGYTRYGEWYGDPYGDWNVMFAAFCLNYAEIPKEAVPWGSDAQSWREALADEKYGLYVEEQDYEQPHAGDLVFFDVDGDREAERVGIVVEYSEAALLRDAKIKTVEGDAEGQVQYAAYGLDDESIMGYGRLPENTEKDIRFTKTCEKQNDYIVTVIYGAEAEIPESAELRVSEYDKESDIYRARYAEAAELYGWNEDKTDSIRLFNIGFFFEGEEIEPAAEVEVSVTYINQAEGKEYQVTHFGREGTETVPAESNYIDGEQTTDFTLDSFSDIMLLAVGEDGFTAYTEDEVEKVDEYIIFLRTFLEGGNNALSAKSYRSDATKYIIKVEDAEKPVLNVKNTDYYLIPVSFLEDKLEGYEFDKNACPFVYSPDANHSGDNMTRASYVKVGSDWYLRVVDNGEYGNYTENGEVVSGAIPRNNVYYGGPADEASDYSGEWAIVRMNSETQGYAMLADDNADGDDNSARKAKEVTVTTENGASFVSDAVTKWKFEKQAGGTYHISTTVNEETKYLYISETANGPVTLSNTPQEITLIENIDNYPEKVYLCHKSTKNADGDPLAVSHDDESNGFISIGDMNDSDCWMTLCNVTPIVNFHLVNLKGEPLDGNGDFAIRTESATRYVFAEESSSIAIADNVVYIVPEISGYRYIGAKFKDNNTYRMAYSVATKGYADASGAFTGGNSTLRFYITEPTASDQYYSRNMNQAEVNLYYSQEEKNTVNHAGTTINLFDYWVTTKDAADSPGNSSGSYDRPKEGINAGKGLKFKVSNGKDVSMSDANLWTGSAAPCQGIVQNKLSDGYPVLSGNKKLEEFKNQSLNYLFDPREEIAYRESHTNVKNLLQIDDDGYYYYDCRENYAEFDETSNRFTLYTEPCIDYKGDTGQFFPFNPVIEAVGITNTYDRVLNHYFGMTMSTHFIQQDGGKMKDNKDMIFEFSGDDDVWIFIDDVLVADLGGIHDAAKVNINFASGEISINDGDIKTTIRSAFATALGEDNLSEGDWNGDTFADASTHTLDFFYLERGNNASNMKLKFNLVEIPVTSIFKVNQYGSPVAGAKFAVYAADEYYNYLYKKGGERVEYPDNYEYEYSDDGDIIVGKERVEALYCGITDSGGEMVFVNKNRHDMPYTIAELEETFGSHFILREIEVPDGYRLVNDEIKLSISEGVNKVLLCHNTYDSGVWAAPTLQVTATNDIYLSNYPDSETPKSEHSYYTGNGTNGTLFAVVFKRKENAPLSAESSWVPVYGNNMQGYTVLDDDRGLISRAIQAAKEQTELGDRVTFYLSASGNMQAELKNLPGDIAFYYYMLDSGDKEKTEYTVAYYWTEADSLNGANESNTWRVLADSDDDSTYNGFTRVFGSTIQVPNMINRLFVQKMDDKGKLVNGAGFALYNVLETLNDDTSGNSSTIYYVAKNKKGEDVNVFLKEDEDGNNQGKAWLTDGREENGGTYKVDSATGVITVTINGTEYTIIPVEINTTKYDAEENGTASFTKLVAGGYYYVREISAPEGYQLNSAQIMVRVTDDAILANAGTAHDGVVVARGPGYVASTLDQFASQGRIDNTLTWILTQMRISGESTSFDVTDKDAYYSEWKYIINNYEDNPKNVSEERSGAIASYLKYDIAAGNTVFNYTVNEERTDPEPAESLTRRLYTDVGWSYLEIYQDYIWGEEEVKKTPGVNYQKLVKKNENGKDEALEISNLFSRSVYIQVTDQRKCNLEISKTVVNPTVDDDKVDTSTFKFTVNLKDASNDDLTGTYNYKVYNVTYNEDGSEKNRMPAVKDGGEQLTGNIQNGGQIDISHNQLIVIEGLPGGTIYTVTEEKNQAYSVTAKEKVLKTADYPNGIKLYDFKAGEKLAVGGELYWHEENGVLDNVSRVSFTNTLRTTTIIAQKEWRGAGGEEVLLSLYRVVGNGTPEQAGSIISLDGSTSDGEPISVVENSKATYQRNAWTVTWKNLPAYVSVDGTMMECKWYVVEAAVANFRTSYSEENTLTINGVDTKAGEAVTGEDGIKYVTVINTSAYSLPETGGGGAAMLRIIGMMCMLTACLYGLCMKKRTGGEALKNRN